MSENKQFDTGEFLALDIPQQEREIVEKMRDNRIMELEEGVELMAFKTHDFFHRSPQSVKNYHHTNWKTCKATTCRLAQGLLHLPPFDYSERGP